MEPFGETFPDKFSQKRAGGRREEGGQAEEIRRWKANHSWLEQLAAVSDFQWRRDHLMTFWRQPLSYVIIYLFVLLHTDISSYSNIRIIRHILQKQIIAGWWELSNIKGGIILGFDIGPLLARSTHPQSSSPSSCIARIAPHTYFDQMTAGQYIEG